MSKILQMIKDELPKTMGQLDYDLLYQDICKAVKEVEELKLSEYERGRNRGIEESAEVTEKHAVTIFHIEGQLRMRGAITTSILKLQERDK